MNRAARRRAERPHEHRFTPGPATVDSDGKLKEGAYEDLACDVCEIRLEDVPEGEVKTMSFIPGYSPGLIEYVGEFLSEGGEHSWPVPANALDMDAHTADMSGLRCTHCGVSWMDEHPGEGPIITLEEE